MKIGKYLLAALLVMGFAAVGYAAPVGLTSEADVTEAELWEYNDIEATAGFVADILNERKIDIDSGEFEMQAFMARLSLIFMQRFNVYVDLGQAQDMEYNYVIQGETYKTEFDDEFLWGIGASGLIYRWENGIEIGANASYRQADMNIEQTTIDNISYAKSTLTNVNDGEFQEYQGALEVGWRIDFITPYIGVKYSEVEVDADFTVGGAQHNASGKNASENFGAFVGFTIAPKTENMPKLKQLTLNVEGRFIDEEAVSVGLAYKF